MKESTTSRIEVYLKFSLVESVFIVCDDKRTLLVLGIRIKKIKIKCMCSTVISYQRKIDLKI